jgi:hypothetical protein
LDQFKYEIEEKFHYMIGKHIGTTSIMWSSLIGKNL